MKVRIRKIGYRHRSVNTGQDKNPEVTRADIIEQGKLNAAKKGGKA